MAITTKAARGRTTANTTTAPHPGRILLEQHIKLIGINPNRLAYELRIPQQRVAEIVHERRSISPDTALRLARFFCTTPEYWLDLQRNYDLDKARYDAGETITKDVKDGCEKGKKQI